MKECKNKPHLTGRAAMRGKPLNEECKKAHRSTGEYGPNDTRGSCDGLTDDWGEDIREECLTCLAYVFNAKPL